MIPPEYLQQSITSYAFFAALLLALIIIRVKTPKERVKRRKILMCCIAFLVACFVFEAIEFVGYLTK